MSEPALVVSQSGEVTDGLSELVAARGCEPVTTLVTDRPEDGRYYLSPATIEDVESRSPGVGGRDLLLVVDGSPHVGQVVDLGARLPSVTLRDRRSAVWERLGAGNPVAATRFELWQSRVARREVAGSPREETTDDPGDTSGRLAGRDRRIQALRATLERRQETARERVRASYDGVDGRVVLLGRVGAPTAALWTALTGDFAPAVAGRPAQPTSATTTIGAHTLAVTATPGVPGRSGLPAWLTEAVPGLTTALQRAACVVGVGDRTDALRAAVGERFDAAWRSVESATATGARAAVRDALETAECALRLPYDDATHAFVSDLHDRGIVHETEYDDAVYLHVEIPPTAVDEVRRRASGVGGETRVLDAG
jgi:hypothetical protein